MNDGIHTAPAVLVHTSEHNPLKTWRVFLPLQSELPVCFIWLDHVLLLAVP